MQHISRRRFLRLSGMGAASGGLAGILASGRAPAYAQGTTLHWLKFVDFVPVSDQLLRGKITDECQKALGIKLQVETINGDGVQARITSAIQSKTGPDILMAVNNWSQLYAESVSDVSDVAEEIGKAQGGYYETAHAVANDGKKWIAVPYTTLFRSRNGEPFFPVIGDRLRGFVIAALRLADLLGEIGRAHV